MLKTNNMTVNKSEVITIPKWIVIVLLPILISTVGVFVGIKVGLTSTAKQVEVNTRRLDVVETTKADKEILKMINDRLTAIDNKIDRHIANDKR